MKVARPAIGDAGNWNVTRLRSRLQMSRLNPSTETRDMGENELRQINAQLLNLTNEIRQLRVAVQGILAALAARR